MHFWVCRSLENFESLNNRANMAGRKRKILTLQERVKVVDRLEKGDSEGGDEEEEDEEEPPVTPAVSRQTASDCADSLLTFALTHNNPTVVELMCQVKFQLQLEHAAKSTKQTEIADVFNIQ